MYRALLASIYGLIALGAGQIFLSSLPGAEIRYIGNRIDRGKPSKGPSWRGWRWTPRRARRPATVRPCDRCDPSSSFISINRIKALTMMRGSPPSRRRVSNSSAMPCLARRRTGRLGRLRHGRASIAADPALLNRLLELSLWTAPVERAALLVGSSPSHRRGGRRAGNNGGAGRR